MFFQASAVAGDGDVFAYIARLMVDVKWGVVVDAVTWAEYTLKEVCRCLRWWRRECGEGC